MKKIVIIVIVLLCTSLVFGQQVVKNESSLSFEQTLDKLESSIESKGLTIFETIDHKEAAEGVNLTMNEATVIIFGNPAVGTLLMNDNMAMSYELPLSIVVYEDENGNVIVLTKLLSKNMVSKELRGRIDAVNNLLKTLVKMEG